MQPRARTHLQHKSTLSSRPQTSGQHFQLSIENCAVRRSKCLQAIGAAQCRAVVRLTQAYTTLAQQYALAALGASVLSILICVPLLWHWREQARVLNNQHTEPNFFYVFKKCDRDRVEAGRWKKSEIITFDIYLIGFISAADNWSILLIALNCNRYIYENCEGELQKMRQRASHREREREANIVYNLFYFSRWILCAVLVNGV